MTDWRVAKSLLTLREQVNQKWPNRKKDSDGTIGNAEHSARESDHNPDADGVVKAMDITHDPKGGCDSYLLAEQLRVSNDPRIKYIISNCRICSGTGQDHQAWVWRKYNGANHHDHHVHISVKADKAHFDNEALWDFSGEVFSANLPASDTYIEPPKTLRLGARGDEVKLMQTELAKFGVQLAADGIFGPGTAAGLQKFQREHGIVADAICGPQTWAALKKVV